MRILSEIRTHDYFTIKEAHFEFQQRCTNKSFCPSFGMVSNYITVICFLLEATLCFGSLFPRFLNVRTFSRSIHGNPAGNDVVMCFGNGEGNAYAGGSTTNSDEGVSKHVCKGDKFVGVVRTHEPECASEAYGRIQSLLGLGYSNAEISALKPTVAAQIQLLNVPRPREGIAMTWFRKDTKDEERRSHMNNQHNGMSGARRAAISVSSKRKFDKRERLAESTVDFIGSSGGSTTFAWRANNSTVVDASFADAAEGSKAINDDLLYEYNTVDIDEFDYSDELNFLPTLREFRSMLRKESKLRMNIVGDWIAPLLRLENKLRYKAYEGFLYFLDTGLSEVVDKVLTAVDVDGDGDRNIEHDDYDYLDNEYERRRGRRGRRSSRGDDCRLLPPEEDERAHRRNKNTAVDEDSELVHDEGR